MPDSPFSFFLRARCQERLHRVDYTEYFQTNTTTKVLCEKPVRYDKILKAIRILGSQAGKEMIPKLMRFLLEQSPEHVKDYIEKAATISEQQTPKRLFHPH